MLRRTFSLLLLLLPISVGAVTTASGAASSVIGAPPAPVDSLLQVVLALGGVIAVIFVLAWLLRRMQSGGGFSSRGLKVVAMLPLSPRERVVLVQIGEQQVLLGVAPGRVSLLQNYEQPIVVPGKVASTDFAGRLRQALRPEDKA